MSVTLDHGSLYILSAVTMYSHTQNHITKSRFPLDVLGTGAGDWAQSGSRSTRISPIHSSSSDQSSLVPVSSG
jgi:hypothetical protein